MSGQGGHDAAFRVAIALVRGFLLPQPDARHVLALWNEKLAKPKWSKGELEHKLKQATEKVRETHWRWGYLLKGEAKWEEVVSDENEAQEDSEKPQDQRSIEPRLVYIAAHDKFMWFSEGVEVPGVAHWQSFFNQSGAVGMLQNAGYTFRKASQWIKEKRCHIVKDFLGHSPTNQRIVEGLDGKKYLNLPQHLIPEPLPGDTPLIDPRA